MPITPIRRLADEVTRLPEGTSPGGSAGNILDVALRLFAERGFAGASIRDIAEAAGIRSATLYGQFPSKSDILAEIIRIGHAEHHRRLKVALADSEANPSDQLIAVVRAHVEVHAHYPMLAVVTNNELHCLSAEQAAESHAIREHSRTILLQILQSGADAGTFKIDNVMTAAAAISAMGVRVANWFTPDLGISEQAVADDMACYACRLVGIADPQRR